MSLIGTPDEQRVAGRPESGVMADVLKAQDQNQIPERTFTSAVSYQMHSLSSRTLPVIFWSVMRVNSNKELALKRKTAGTAYLVLLISVSSI